MDLDLLKTFLEVTRTRHFGKAAENLYLTQSAVSARIRLLESQLQCPLFQRHHKQVNLTPAGEKLARHAAAILDAWSSARADICGEADRQQPLRIVSHPLLWHYLLASRLPPGWPAGLATLSSTARPAIETLQALQADLFVSHLPADSALDLQPIAELQLVPVTASSRAQAPDWDNAVLIDLDWGPAFDRFRQRQKAGKLARSMFCDSAAVAEHWLAAGNGIAWLPLAAIEHNPALAEVNDAGMTRFSLTVNACHVAGQSPAALLRRLIDCLHIR
ncbi:MAG TPA: LysR family transcriptional regulator [Pseudomonadales bacterium]